MPIVDAYARVSDLQQLVGTLTTGAQAQQPTDAAPATSFDAQLTAALPTADSTVAAPQVEVQVQAPAAGATQAATQLAHPSGCCCCCCGSPEPTATAAQPELLAEVDPTASPGRQALSVAEGQLGQAEQPPGSNDGPALAAYRSAVAGAYPGAPWCAYFVSWASQQAGHPLGDGGQGLGSVAQITDWAQRTGRLLPTGTPPQPGDLILFGDRHVGLVESVAADGSLTTVEGNYRNQVSRVTRSPSEATGFVRL